MDNDYFNLQNLQKWGRIFQDYESEIERLQTMFNDYYRYNNDLDKLRASMEYGEPEHFELIRNSQTMTDQENPCRVRCLCKA